MNKVKRIVTVMVITIAIILSIRLVTIADDNPKTIHSPVEIPTNVQDLIKQANKDVEIAQLKKDNLILQVRLLLKVPNDYSYDESNAKFMPPKPSELKLEPKANPKP